MEFNLRDYQREALDVIHNDMQTEQNVLLQAVTGAGKTVTIARLINKYFFDTNRRFLILAHKQELVEQFQRTFSKMTDIPFMAIGICCAGLGSRDISKRVTIATVQTFVNIVNDYNGCDLLVIDEVHNATIGDNSQYDQVITSLRDKQPNMRLLGITATPFSLGRGYCYGDKVKPGIQNIFPRLNHRIKYSQLLEQGHLCRLIGKVAHADQLGADLSEVAVNGDYVIDQLGEIMAREVHLATAIQAIHEFCGGYRHICVFCCTIDHAEKLARMIGDEAVPVHSQLSKIERAENMAAWTSGSKRICTSVNILAEGFDFPPLDCLVFARPTFSARLYLQAIGRVLRISPGKDHGFLLDLTPNTATFGTDIDKVKVAVPKTVQDKIDKENELNKICPMCEAEVHKALRICPCGFEWPAPEVVEANHVPDVSDVEFSPTKPEWYQVHQTTIAMHQAKSGKWLGKVTFDIGGIGYRRKTATLWLCLPDYYSGYAVDKARKWWEILYPGVELPERVEEIDGIDIVSPVEILVDESGEYPEIKELKYDEVPF